MEKYKNIDKILSDWKKKNSLFEKDGTIDEETGSVCLTIFSINSLKSISINCKANEKDVLVAIEKNRGS